MQQNFLPYNYDELMFQKFQNLRQGSRTVDEYATEFFKMINRFKIRDTEQQLIMCFIWGLRQQIQYTLNLFQTQSISEAHQQAITIETQIRGGFSAWGSNRQLRAKTNTTSSSITNDSTVTKTEMALLQSAEELGDGTNDTGKNKAKFYFPYCKGWIWCDNNIVGESGGWYRRFAVKMTGQFITV